MKKYSERFNIYIPNKGIYILVLCSKRCKSCDLLLTTLDKLKHNCSIKLKDIENINDCLIAQELNIDTIPALIFFKNGNFLDQDFRVYGETFVNNGVMVGAYNELILREVIKQM